MHKQNAATATPSGPSFQFFEDKRCYDMDSEKYVPGLQVFSRTHLFSAWVLHLFLPLHCRGFNIILAMHTQAARDTDFEQHAEHHADRRHHYDHALQSHQGYEIYKCCWLGYHLCEHSKCPCKFGCYYRGHNHNDCCHLPRLHQFGWKKSQAAQPKE